MSNRRCGVGAPWCARADEMLSAPGRHVIDVDHDGGGRLVVTVECLVPGLMEWCEPGFVESGCWEPGHGDRLLALELLRV